jgi:hypothetical protein
MKKFTLMFAIVLVVLSLGTAAMADNISFNLLSPPGAPAGGPFVSVNVNRTSGTSATVTFTFNGTASSTQGMIDSGVFDLNVNASSFTASGGTCSSFTGSNTCSSPGSGQVDGMGTFNLTLDLGNAANPVGSLSVVVTNGSGTWANASSVLIANALKGGSLGNEAASHVKYGGCTFYVGGASDGNGGTTGGTTSPTTCGTTTPEPGSLGLLGAGLLGLGGLIRRKRS